MIKEKINLEQLYQERFQSFEKKPSSNTFPRMQKKIRHFKTLQLIKRIAFGALIAAIAITLLSLFSDELQTQVNTNEYQVLTEQSIEKYNSQNNQNFNTQALETKNEDNTKSYIQNEQLNKESTTINKTTEKQLEFPTEQEDAKEFAIIVKENKVLNDKKSKTSFKSPLSTELDKAQVRYPEKLDPIELNMLFLQRNSETLHLDQRNLNLTPGKRSDTSQGKTKFRKNKQAHNKQSGNKLANWNGYFDLHLSPLLWHNNTNSEAPDLDTSWTYLLDSKPQLSYEFGFSFQLHHAKLPLFMQFGLDYQILKEKIDFQLVHTFEDPELSYWTYDSIFDISNVIDTFYIIVDSNHFVIDTIYTQDTVLSNVDSLYNSVMTSEENRKNHVNTYTYLNIPLLLGYQFQSKDKKWNFQILAGAAVAINLNNQGYYYTKTGDFESYSGKVTPSLVWNFYAAASINYHLKKWQLFVQPEYQHQLNKSQISNQPPRRKYQFYKIKFGFRYQLF